MVIVCDNPLVGWRKAICQLPRPNILTAGAAHSRKLTFTPTYEIEPHNMAKLISNHYLRQWLEERDRCYRFVARTKIFPRLFKKKIIIRKKAAKFNDIPIITLKRFQNIPAKVDSNLANLRKKHKEYKET